MAALSVRVPDRLNCATPRRWRPSTHLADAFGDALQWPPGGKASGRPAARPAAGFFEQGPAKGPADRRAIEILLLAVEQRLQKSAARPLTGSGTWSSRTPAGVPGPGAVLEGIGHGEAD